MITYVIMKTKSSYIFQHSLLTMKVFIIHTRYLDILNLRNSHKKSQIDNPFVQHHIIQHCHIARPLLTTLSLHKIKAQCWETFHGTPHHFSKVHTPPRIPKVCPPPNHFPQANVCPPNHSLSKSMYLTQDFHPNPSQYMTQGCLSKMFIRSTIPLIHVHVLDIGYQS